MLDENSYWWGVEIGLRAAAVIVERAESPWHARIDIRAYADKVLTHRERDKKAPAATERGEREVAGE